MHGPRSTDHAFALPHLQAERPTAQKGTSSPSSSDPRPTEDDPVFTRRASAEKRLEEKSHFMREIKDLNSKTKKGLVARQEVVRKIPYFSELEAILPGFSDSVAEKAEFVAATAGTVVYRQGDPAMWSYFIVSGKVAIHERGYRPRTPDYEESRQVRQSCWMRCCPSCRSKSRDRLHSESEKDVDPTTKSKYVRKKTLEGFSTYSSASDFGKRKQTVQKGGTFGDGALSTQERREKTAVCLDSCELVRVHKGSFDIDMAEKVRFFKRHVPGFQDIRIHHHKDHPAFAFEDRRFPQGTTLLEEGSAPRPSIYIIRNGAVSFRRNKQTKLGGGHKKHRCWLVMKDTEMFSTLGMLGVGNLETCTAVVTSKECFCYVLSGSTVEDFQDISKEYISAMLDHVRQTMRPLLQLSAAFCGVDAVGGNQFKERRSWGSHLLGSTGFRSLFSSRGSSSEARQSSSSKIYAAPSTHEDLDRLSVRSVY